MRLQNGCGCKICSSSRERLRILHSHGDAHAGKHAMRRCWYYFQPLRDQRCGAVEVRLEVNELLFAAAVVGLEAAEARPFRTGIIVAVSVEGGSHAK